MERPQVALPFRPRAIHSLEALAAAGGLPRSLRAAGVREAELPDLAAGAAEQWTGRFNPRPFDAAAALALYKCAL